jgi:hypothetical protein
MLQITEKDGAYRFSGDTYNFRDLIKALPGARWAPATKTWTAPKGADLAAIRARLAQYDHERAFWAAAAAAAKAATAHLSRPQEEWTRAQWRAFCASKRGNHGPCCSAAKAFTQYDAQGPICYRCEKHGETYNSYCGD